MAELRNKLTTMSGRMSDYTLHKNSYTRTANDSNKSYSDLDWN